MSVGATVDEVFQVLYAQAQTLWGEAYAEQKRAALRQTAEEIVIVNTYPVAPDLEPQFF